MCRFIAYKGRPVLLDEVLYQPKNSLIRQSAQAHEAEEPLNGDGFGLGWYAPESGTEPGIFASVRPAWNDRNLRSLCKHIITPSFFAHVRAASEGEVSEANCHPFQFGRYMFMHNGGIGGFNKVKRQLRRKLSDDVYDWIRGQTDSEHLFGLLLEKIKEQPQPVGSRGLTAALEETIRDVQRMKAEAGVTEACYINCVITDGQVVVAARYVSDPNEKASTLYFSEGHHYECVDGICRMVPGNAREHSVLIVSEKLTSRAADWREIPSNQICVVDEKLAVTLHAIDDGALVRGEAASAPAQPSAGRGFKPKAA